MCIPVLTVAWKHGTEKLLFQYTLVLNLNMFSWILGTYFISTHSAKHQRKWLSHYWITCFHGRCLLCLICQEKGNTVRDSWILLWYFQQYYFCEVKQTFHFNKQRNILLKSYRPLHVYTYSFTRMLDESLPMKDSLMFVFP